MHPVEFQRKWTGVSLTEKSASQSHFIDLCHVLGVPTPTDLDPDGSFYTFEKGASKSNGGQGWADVWYRGHFGWEYKGPKKDLGAAYDQLLRYKDDLENPPLLVVSDLDRIEVHTNFTDTVKQVHVITLAAFTEPDNQRLLKGLFENPQALKPDLDRQIVTEEAAKRFGQIAQGLQARGEDPHAVAHFLVQALFCLFAEDIGLLPRRVFSRLLDFGKQNPKHLRDETQRLLDAMSTGGFVSWETIPHFNGGLFRDVHALELTTAEVDALAAAADLDWSAVEPAIFGTLFERSLDPAQRSQLGAHYTGRADIERVVDPVV
ncbi:MAG: type IIL restriction-modification enzyme MmeI, partial [Thermomicrobiales bacterium]